MKRFVKGEYREQVTHLPEYLFTYAIASVAIS